MELTEATLEYDNATNNKAHYIAQIKKFDARIKQEEADVQKFYEGEVQVCCE